MKRLLLFRHAKSSWNDPTLADFDRPLAERGVSATSPMAAWLRKNDYLPDLVLCSTARRAVETWERLLAGLGRAVEVRMLHDLYLAEPDRILELLRTSGGQATTVMVIGHNPGMEELARALARDGNKKDLRRMHRKFPTAAVAVLTFGTDRWEDVLPGTGTLEAFARPKDMVG